jgi:hypothetical protein
MQSGFQGDITARMIGSIMNGGILDSEGFAVYSNVKLRESNFKPDNFD